MMISIYKEFQLIDESIIEELYWEENNSISTTNKRIKRLVHKHIKGKSYRNNSRLKIAVICSLVIILTIPTYAAVNYILEASMPVNETNKNFIGKEIQDTYYIIYRDGKYIDSNGKVVDMNITDTKSVLASSRIVSKIEQPNFMPNSIVEIESVDYTHNKCAYPELILINGSACILTSKNAQGWNLSAGDQLAFNFDKYPSEVVDKQNLIIGVVKDGVLLEGNSFWDDKGEYSYIAKEKGLYYIYLISGSSDYLTLKESTVIKK